MIKKACKISDIEDNSLNKIMIGKKEVMIGKKNEKLFACDNSCPHKGASLHKGDIKNNSLICYMHGYEFDIDSGKLTNMKSWKKRDTWMEQSPAWRESGDLKMYNVEIKKEDVFVEI